MSEASSKSTSPAYRENLLLAVERIEFMESKVTTNTNNNFILGIKKKMTQIFNESGEAVPVTVIAAGPCSVTQVKKAGSEGYTAVQIGYGKKNKISKPLKGHLQGLDSYKYLREFYFAEAELNKIKRQQQIKVDTFTVGEKVKVVGIGKGKGFQGVVKRHGFSGSPASHGHKDQLRMPGSIGATDAARVFKGTKMGGRMGGGQVTVANLVVVKIDPDNNLLYLRGAVPGRRGGLLKILGQGELKLSPPELKENNIKQEPTDAADGVEVKDAKPAVAIEKSKVINSDESAAVAVAKSETGGEKKAVVEPRDK